MGLILPCSFTLSLPNIFIFIVKPFRCNIFFPIFISWLLSHLICAKMKEEFLHYQWKYSLYDPDSLLDTDGNKISVIHPGEYNRDSGPDFFNSRISVDGTVWAGNIEIHTLSSHFDLHGHQYDPAFNNVILHVVAENDKRIFNQKKEEILTVKIEFDPLLYERYLSLVNNPYIIACQEELKKVDNIIVRHWLNALVVERFQNKSMIGRRLFTDCFPGILGSGLTLNLLRCLRQPYPSG